MNFSTCLFPILLVMISILLTPWPSAVIIFGEGGIRNLKCFRRQLYSILGGRTYCRQDGRRCHQMDCSKSDGCRGCEQHFDGKVNFSQPHIKPIYLRCVQIMLFELFLDRKAHLAFRRKGKQETTCLVHLLLYIRQMYIFEISSLSNKAIYPAK